MGRPTKTLSTINKHLTKLEIASRTEAEAQVLNVATKPKPIFDLNKTEKKLFNKYIKLNDSFTEADSTSLSLLVSSMYDYNEIREAIRNMDVLDERRIVLERRLMAYDKAITTHMVALSIPLTQRLRLANDMAKVMIEEKKLEQMSNDNKPQEVNPLLALLEELK